MNRREQDVFLDQVDQLEGRRVAPRLLALLSFRRVDEAQELLEAADRELEQRIRRAAGTAGGCA